MDLISRTVGDLDALQHVKRKGAQPIVGGWGANRIGKRAGTMTKELSQRSEMDVGRMAAQHSPAQKSGHHEHISQIGQAVAVLLHERQMSDQARGSGGWWDMMVIGDENAVRIVWNMWLALLLLYTGTVFPFKLAFIDFGIPARSFPGWYRAIEIGLLDVGFYIDLVANFFFTYRDDRGRQVFDMRKIALRYLRGYFLINLIACIPSEIFSWVFCYLINQHPCTNTASVNQVGRLSRLQRVSRMARLARLTRLGKLAGFLTDSPALQKIRTMRGVRITNSFFGLIFIVHLVACGWWICAAIHEEHDVTWLNRRILTLDGRSMLDVSEADEYGPLAQWLTSMYWTLTVFTTVGFGDISAFTCGEMVYACFTMIVGCIVNGMILSEVITILTTVNEEVRLIEDQQHLIRSFGKHMQVSTALTEELTKWVSATKIDHSNYNREEMKSIVTSGILPRRLLNVLPQALFNGRLVANKLIQEAHDSGFIAGKMPPRFPVLLALACQQFYYDSEQLVYHAQDHAWNVYLVMRGIFSYIAKPVATTRQNLHYSFSMSQTLLPVGKNFPVQASYHMEQVGHYPYMLFGQANYFGDIEIIHETCPRFSSARCESKEGSVLVLHKRDLYQLVEEFPRVTSGWRVLSKRRERHRRSMLMRLNPFGQSYRDLASSLIAKNLRYLMLRKKEPTPESMFDYRHVSLTPMHVSKRRRHRHEPTEIVPQYVRDLDTSISDLQEEVSTLKDVLLDEVRDIKEALRDSGLAIPMRAVI